MQKEFNLKDFFFYSLNRWFYIVLSVAVCAVIAIGVGIYKQAQGRDTLTYRASAVICEIETYAEIFDPEGAPVVLAGYQNNSKRAMDIMTSADNYNEFVKHEPNRQLVIKLNNGQASNPGRFLGASLSFINSDYRLDIRFTIAKNNATWSNEDVAALLDAYVGFVIDRVYDNVDSFAALKRAYDADEIVAPIKLIPAERFEAVASERGRLFDALVGAAAGIVLGLGIILVLFLIDPKIKSAQELARAGFVVVAQPDKAGLESEKLASIAASLDKAQGICVFQPGGGTYAASFARALANYLQETGSRTLCIDGMATDGSFRAYLEGASLESESESGAVLIAFTKSDDYVYMLAKRERVAELGRLYDKIVICCNATHAGAIAACSSFASAAICVADKASTRIKDVCRAKAEISEITTNQSSVFFLGKAEQK